MAIPLPTGARPRAAGTALALAGACLLAAGCGAGPGSTAGTAAAPGGASAAKAASAAGALPGVPAQGRGSAAGLADLPAPGSQYLIRRARLTVRTRDVAAAAAQAARLTTAAGGYVSDESAQLAPPHHGQPTASLVLKIPAAAYPSVLPELSSRLGQRLSMSQSATDATQAVADVSSRVASARAAIAQLRRLLARAGSVSGLLGVQDQINQQEADLEALLSQQRALSRETSYATVSLRLLGPAARRHGHPAAGPAGFGGGLAAGWRALVVTVSWLLTALGAALPFALPVALLAAAGYLARRRLGRGRPGASPAE